MSCALIVHGTFPDQGLANCDISVGGGLVSRLVKRMELNARLLIGG